MIKKVKTMMMLTFSLISMIFWTVAKTYSYQESIKTSSYISHLFSDIWILIIAIVVIAITTNALCSFIKLTLNNDILTFANNLNEEKEMSLNEFKEFRPITETFFGLNKKIDKYRGRWRNESEKIALIFENMTEGMVILDEDGYVLNINKSAVDMLTNDSIVPGMTHIFELIPPKELTEFVETTKENRIIKEIVLNNGAVVRAYINRVITIDTNCVIIILAGVNQRIEAEKLRREFSANVSHELKTPLTIIKGFGEMFGSGMITESDDVKKYGLRIQQESQRLLFLINDIMRLSELEESDEQSLSKVSLVIAAKETIELLSEKAKESEVEMQLKGDPSWYCMYNDSYIKELFTNLIDNAIKYNKKGGYVKIDIYKEDSNSVIIIKDNGIGIPDKDKDRIFERFYRVDKSHSRKTGGTGLGLSIVKHIVSYHKGSVHLKSKLGEGTEIKVVLPISSENK